MNIPDLGTGQTQNPMACMHSETASNCPQGFSCINGFCELNGGSSPLQVTLSFDDNEDFDLHVREPAPGGGDCEIYYGNVGPRPYPDGGPGPQSGYCDPVGWLDRDSNAGCGNLDGINIENVFYPTNVPAPSGTYSVYVDYWSNCTGSLSSNYAVQVRRNGVTYLYCGTFGFGQDDTGGLGSGTFITLFTMP
jgi:hypothetical protein